MRVILDTNILSVPRPAPTSTPLVATARANGLEPGASLNFLFENLPAAETVEALEALLPWSPRRSLPTSRRAA
jgi:hypothetical protein